MIEVNPYFAPGERYPSIIGVKADGDEYELAYIRKAEAMEREPIVRCRDCAFAYRVNWPVSCDVPPEFLNCQGPLVTLWDYERDEPKDNPVEPDGFCAWGKRRDGGGE